MLRYAGRKASRVISNRGTATAPAAATSSGTTDLLLLLQHRGQSRSFSSWLTPTPAPLAAAKAAGGGGSSKFGIATGLELEELEAHQKGEKRFDLDAPRGPFGTKNHPAVVESVYDERIVGCSGGVGGRLLAVAWNGETWNQQASPFLVLHHAEGQVAEDEHDVTWFKLRKGEELECPVCTQVFELKVVGEGGLPGAHH